MQSKYYCSDLKVPLGQGAYGSVFKGKSRHGSTEVAVKRIQFNADDENDPWYKSAEKEFEALKIVSGHSNCVNFLDMLIDSPNYYLVMEYCDLGNLESYLKSKFPEIEEKVNIMYDCASAIEYMHNLQPPVMHRDIKPGNILMKSSRHGVTVKMADFGMAKIFDIKKDTTFVHGYTNVGSLPYRAPELFCDEGLKYTKSIDVFSLGLVFSVIIKFEKDFKKLEPTSGFESKGPSPYIPYAYKMCIDRSEKKPVEPLFLPSPNDDPLRLELKHLVEFMTLYDGAKRKEMKNVIFTLKNIRLQYIEPHTNMKEAHLIWLDGFTGDVHLNMNDICELSTSVKKNSGDGENDKNHKLLQALADVDGPTGIFWSGKDELPGGSSTNNQHIHGSSERSSAINQNIVPDEKYDVVIAIDLGNNFSCYAFSFKNKWDIYMNKKWGANYGMSNYKTSTCLLLDRKKNILAFGYEAQERYADIKEFGDDDTDNFYYFENFKMMTHARKATLTAANGKQIPALDVFAQCLLYFKDHATHAIASLLNLSENSHLPCVRWVITVPVSWDNELKQFMREAAVKGGLISSVDSGKLLIVSKPEAASLYMKLSEPTIFRCSALGHGKEELNFEAGTKYLVIDAGSGTLDVTAHELLRNGKVKELHYATVPFCARRVDDEFTKLMVAIFGTSFIDAFQKKCAIQWLNLMFEFEKKKRALKAGEENSTMVPLSWSFGSKYSQMTGKSVESAFKNYKGYGVEFINGFMCFSYGVMKELFRPALKGIINLIQGIMDMEKLHGVEYFFCTGGFSESTILQDTIYDNFGGAVQILVPKEASLAVVKGAVYFGHETGIIYKTVARRTYGFNTMSEFRQVIHNQEKAVPVEGKTYCKDLFKTFVKKGEEVKPGQNHTIKFSPVHAGQQVADVDIYSTDRTDVNYVTHPTVERIGQITVNWPGSGIDRKLNITITFGGTEIQVSAVSEPGGSRADTKIDFLSM